MRRLLTLLSLVVWIALAGYARNSEPDFNFPRDVITQAQADLKKALKSGDGQQVVDALVRSSLAKSSITIENMSEMVEDIDRVARNERRPDYRALLYHLEARLLSSYAEYFVPIDRRDPEVMPGDTSVKDRYAMWDSRRFDMATDSLIRLALRDREALLRCQVTDYSRIIKCDKLGAEYLPTLYHFINYRSTELAGASLEKQLRADLVDASAGSLTAKTFAQCYDISKNRGSNEAYLALAQQLADHPEAGLPLSQLDSDKYYEALKQYVSRHPRSIYANTINNAIRNIERKEARLNYPGHRNSNRTASGDITVTASVRNVNDLNVRVYRLPKSATARKYALDTLEQVYSQAVRIDGTVPFTDRKNITLPALPYGQYVIVPAYTSQGTTVLPETVTAGDVISVYDLASFSVSESLSSKDASGREKAINRIMVVDDASGTPMAGVRVAAKSWEAITDRRGYVDVPENSEYTNFEYTIARGDDQYAPISRFALNTGAAHGTYSIRIFTDLSIYRPGETIQWAAIVYRQSNDSRTVAADQQVHVTVSDANGQIFDRQTLTTDRYGRVSSETIIPTGRLLGSYHINAQLEHSGTWGVHDVQVSEYKTPTFFVEFEQSDLVFQPGQPVTLSGRAATYSGLPVASATVKLNLKKRKWDWGWWFYRAHGEQITALADTIVTTDNDGKFAVTFSDTLFTELNLLHFSPCLYSYMAHAQATDATGESQEHTAMFRIGNKRQVEFTKSIVHHHNTKPLTLPIVVNNTEPKQEPEMLAYRLINASADTICGTLPSDNPTIDLTKFPSGEYKIRVMLADDEQNYADATLYLYRTGDKTAPLANCPLWIPNDAHYIDDNNVAHVTVGTSTPEAHIYYIAMGRAQVLGEGWIDRDKPGFGEFTFRVPAKADELLRIKFLTYHHSDFYQQEVTMTVPACRQSLRVTATSFRDKLVPGKPERWTFALTDKDGKPQSGAMLIEMYDKALNALSDNTWSFSPGYLGFNPVSVNWTRGANYRSSTANWRADMLDTKRARYTLPYLYTYDRQLWYGCANPFERLMLLGGARPLRMAKDGSAIHTLATETVKSNDIAETQAAVDTRSLEQVEMRLADVKTALWQPTLTSDEQGNISIEFEAPNFNTTWIVQAIAYTTGLTTDMFRAETLTQKPVMVKSSLPRFVRQGDRVRLSANLQNASDHEMPVQAMIEAFDPRTGQVYHTRTFNERIASMASMPLMMSWTIPDTIPYLGFRVRAVGEDFGDGEQVMLPVLPASQAIIETYPFYIDADSEHFSLALPDVPENARVTLEYNDNPVWQCVTALPSIFSDNSHVATSIAHSLYALNVARGVATSQPIIAEAFAYWQENAPDSMLVSTLARNEDLKIGTLLASPWLRTAERQTMQMQQLTRYFDPEHARAEHDRLVQALERLQLSDGGFTWYQYPGAKSSLWTTAAVLELLGDLRQLNYLPEDTKLDQITRLALAYMDGRYVEQSKKKEFKNSIFATWAYTRSMFDNVPMDRAAQKLYKSTINRMAKRWGKLDLTLTAKAFWAMALERGGKRKEALRMTESLRQFALNDSAMGMYWDQYRTLRRFTSAQIGATSVILRAMNSVDPRTAELDQIRKWMLLSKRTTDWGGSSLAADAVQALLASGTQWLQRGQMPDITIDGNDVALDKFDSFVGYSRREIDAHSGSVLAIHRAQGTPAWGSVYCQYTQDMSQVEAAAIDEASITKQFVPLNAAGEPSDRRKLQVGDKVQVRLVITCRQAMDYVMVSDERAACFEPVDKTSGYRSQEGIGYYRETRDATTNLFFDHLPKGTHVITYETFATMPGTFASGVATLQSQQAPEMSAHSAGEQLTVQD